MMVQRKVALATVALALSLAAGAASAAKIYGVWRSNSGNVFEIPRGYEGAFDLIMHARGGKVSLMRGQWVEGMEGTQFTYGSGRALNTGTFSNEAPDKIRVTTPSGKANIWTRDRRASRAALWAGTWKSTSGNIFTVSARRGPFSIVLTRPTGKKEVFVARWVPGMIGTQFTYGSGRQRNTGTYSKSAPGRLRVVDSAGKVNWWEKM